MDYLEDGTCIPVMTGLGYTICIVMKQFYDYNSSEKQCVQPAAPDCMIKMSGVLSKPTMMVIVPINMVDCKLK